MDFELVANLLLTLGCYDKISYISEMGRLCFYSVSYDSVRMYGMLISFFFVTEDTVSYKSIIYNNKIKQSNHIHTLLLPDDRPTLPSAPIAQPPGDLSRGR